VKEQLVKFNEQGRRIGESHPRATLTDHEVELLAGMLDCRDQMIETLTQAGASPSTIGQLLHANGLSFRALAEKFEVSKSQVARIAAGQSRCQRPSP
jgi:hypothetical protein